MSSFPSIGISLALPIKTDTAAHRLGDLLDTLIAIRMDVGHGANGIAASPTLGPEQMREVRVLLDRAIASTKELFGTIHLSAATDAETPFDTFTARSQICTETYRSSRSNSNLTTLNLLVNAIKLTESGEVDVR